MVKANTFIAAFSFIVLIFISNMVYAGDRTTPDPTPRATVTLSQLTFSASEIKSDSSVSTNPSDTAIGKKTDTQTPDGAPAATAEDTASGESAPASFDAADGKTVATLGVAAAGASSVETDGDDDAAAGAAPVLLGSADDTCMGSSAGGGQGTGFGFSLGSTWTDENCKMLKNARELKNQGHHAAAKARLCMDNDNALAFELAGAPCPQALPSAQAAIKTIRDRNPSYRAAADRVIQVAALTGAAARTDQPSAEIQKPSNINGLSSADEENAGGSKFGTLIALVVSAVNRVATGVSADLGVDWDAASAMDGLE